MHLKHNRWLRIQYGIAVLMLLVLPGCFQQAGEAFQPVSSTANPNDLSESGGSGTLPQDASPFPASPTLPPITIIAPTRQMPDTATPVPDRPTTQLTPLPPVDGAGEAATPTTDTQFRTPVSPLGPITQIPPTQTPALQPSATASGLITPTAIGGADSAGSCTYTVQPGDTLFRIAGSNDTTVADLRAANPQVQGDLLQPGQVLELPGCVPGNEGAVVEATLLPPAEAGPVAPPGGTVYTVQPGDTLFAIARRNGVSVQAIVDANNLTNPDALSVGQQLIIPPAS